MINLFDQAIGKSELLDFALGRGSYFIPDREYGDHSIIIAWLNYIIPSLEKNGAVIVNQAINSMFRKIIESDELSEQIKNENLLYHLHAYFYLDSEKRLKAALSRELSLLIESKLTSYATLLKSNNDPKYSAFVKAIDLIKSRGGLSTKPI